VIEKKKSDYSFSFVVYQPLSPLDRSSRQVEDFTSFNLTGSGLSLMWFFQEIVFKQWFFSPVRGSTAKRGGGCSAERGKPIYCWATPQSFGQLPSQGAKFPWCGFFKKLFSSNGFSPLLGGVPRSGEGVVQQKEGSPSTVEQPLSPAILRDSSPHREQKFPGSKKEK
jgi:hypothetical protein